MGLALAGIAVAIARRRWTLLALLPFQLALVGDLHALLRRAPLPAADRDAGLSVRRAGARRACAARAGAGARARSARRGRPLVAACSAWRWRVVVLWRLVWPALLDGGRGAARAPPLGGDGGGVAAPWQRAGGRRDAAPALAAGAAVSDAASPIEGAPNGAAPPGRRRRGPRARTSAWRADRAGGTLPSLLRSPRRTRATRRCGSRWARDRDSDVAPGRARRDRRPVSTHAGGPLELDVALPVRRRPRSGSPRRTYFSFRFHDALDGPRAIVRPAGRPRVNGQVGRVTDELRRLRSRAASAAAAGRRLAGADRGASGGGGRRRRPAPSGRRFSAEFPRFTSGGSAIRTARWSRLQTALAEDPTSGRVIQEMERIARGHGIWGELVAVTAEVAAGLEDRKQASDLWVQIAFWNETGRAQLDEAAKAAETALELEPDARRRAGAARESLSPAAQLGSLRRDPGAPARSAGRRCRASSPTPTARCCATSRGTPARSRASRALHEEAGEWDDAAETLRRLIAALPEGRQRIEAQYRLAKLLKERLRDPRGAEEQLALALALPGGEAHVPSLLLLAALYRERKDWLKARQLLGRAAAAVTDVADRTRLLGEAAEICATALDDEAQAADLYAEILALDRHARAISSRSWPRSSSGAATSPGLLPLAELLASGAEGEPARRARAPSCTGSGARARRRATRRGRSRPTARRPSPRIRAAAPSEATLAARRDLADLTFRREEWSEAAAAYASVLGDPSALSRDAQLVAYERLGDRAAARRRAGRARSSRWRRRWRSIRAAGARSRRWSRRRAPPGTTTRSCATRRRCWRSPTIRRPSSGCSSTWRPSTASAGTIRSARSPPISRRSRSGPTSGRSCTGCSSSTPRPSSGSSRSSSWRGSRSWPTSATRGPLLRGRRQHPGRGARRAAPRRSRPSSRRWTPIPTTPRRSSGSIGW